MSYPPHFLMSFGGPIQPSGVQPLEGWACGIRFMPGAMSLTDSLKQQQACDYVATKVQTWFSDPNLGIWTGAKLAFCKWNAIGPTGNYLNPWTNQHLYSPVIPGGGSPTLNLPVQITLAIGLRTPFRGPRFRGRIYLPCPQASLSGTTLGWSSGYTDAVAASTKTMLAAIALWTGITPSGGDPAVVSKYGEIHPLSGIWVGTIPDTMRSRRRSLVEAYSKVAYP